MTLTVDEAHPEQVDSDVSPIGTPPGDTPPNPPRSLRELVARVRAHPETAITFLVVGACCLLVLRVLHPTLLLKDTTPAGGDMGAHVWGPAFLRDHLLPKWRLFGWTPDWYAGFPAFQFYMVIPALMIVALDVVLPYGVAFKLVSVLGLVTLPMPHGHSVASRCAVPDTCAIGGGHAAVHVRRHMEHLRRQHRFHTRRRVFLLDRLQRVSRVLRHADSSVTRRKGARHHASLLALVLLCHLLVFFLALFGTAAILAVWFRRTSHGWLLPSAAMFATAAALTAFWALPCFLLRGYTSTWAGESSRRTSTSCFRPFRLGHRAGRDRRRRGSPASRPSRGDHRDHGRHRRVRIPVRAQRPPVERPPAPAVLPLPSHARGHRLLVRLHHRLLVWCAAPGRRTRGV